MYVYIGSGLCHQHLDLLRRALRTALASSKFGSIASCALRIEKVPDRLPPYRHGASNTGTPWNTMEHYILIFFWLFERETEDLSSDTDHIFAL